MARTAKLTTLLASLACMLAFALASCSAPGAQEQEADDQATVAQQAATQENDAGGSDASDSTAEAEAQQAQGNKGGFGGTGGGMDTQPGQTNDKGYTANDSGIAITDTLSPADAFTERDLQQTADTAGAASIALADGKTETVSEEGVYVVSGTATNATIVVDAPDTAKVQLVLDGVSVTNADFPAIYVKSADKVFVTLVGENALSVTGDFAADGDTNTDAVIFSKDDLCLNGTGSLAISSTDHAVVSKDDLKVTGGTYTITAEGNGLRANDSVRIAGGTFDITAEDGIKAKNDDDNELGYVYIQDGTFRINASDNGIQGYAFVWIDGGTFDLSSEECIEGTYIQINGGELALESSDDGINASIKSSVYTPTIEINGGSLTINMAQGDTDALDSNGYLYINGGKVDIAAQSAFDYAWGAKMTGGEVYVNGGQVSEIAESMMGPGGGMGGADGQEGFDGRGGPGGKGRHGGQPPEGMQPGEGGQPPEGVPSDGGAPQPGDGTPQPGDGGQPPELGAEATA